MALSFGAGWRATNDAGGWQEEGCRNAQPSDLLEMNAKALNRLIRRRDSAAGNLKEAREKLALEAARSDSHHLSHLLGQLAEHEGRLFAFAEVIRLAEAGEDARIADLLIGLATRGAEDSWSGRTNDASRSRFDGILAAVRETHETIAAFAEDQESAGAEEIASLVAARVVSVDELEEIHRLVGEQILRATGRA